MTSRHRMLTKEELECSWHWCPICGNKARNVGHKCPPRTLSGIDGANTKAWNQELAPPSEHLPPIWRTEDVRLTEGFRLLADD